MMVAILMTILNSPDADLRWVNWLKLLHMPHSLIQYRSPKIVKQFAWVGVFVPFDTDSVLNSVYEPLHSTEKKL